MIDAKEVIKSGVLVIVLSFMKTWPNTLKVMSLRRSNSLWAASQSPDVKSTSGAKRSNIPSKFARNAIFTCLEIISYQRMFLVVNGRKPRKIPLLAYCG
jgi:hypothetical protein